MLYKLRLLSLCGFARFLDIQKAVNVFAFPLLGAFEKWQYDFAFCLSKHQAGVMQDRGKLKVCHLLIT